ncbi:hypothetical protein BH11ACT3_BH11ACT3_10070 [soil metagenome]
MYLTPLPNFVQVIMKVPSVNGVRIQGPEGFAVGDDVSAYLAEHPADDGGAAQFDVANVSDGLGAWLSETDSTVDSMVAPARGLYGESCE